MAQYINKSALVAEIERQISAIDNCPKLTDTQIAVLEGNKVVLTKLLSFLDTLEVKEVDLEIPMWVREVPRKDVFDDGWYIGFDDCLHRKGYKIKICDLWKLPKEPLNV